MGRHRLQYHPLYYGGANPLTPRYEEIRTEETWIGLYRTAYTQMLGQRLRRIREGRRLTQAQALRHVKRPNGGSYSRALLSRIEAGYGNSPLYVYIHLAEGYEIDPGRLMGPEESEKVVGEAEMALIKFLRRLGIPPDEAMARLARP